MRKIKCKNRTISVNNEALAAAYCGAYCGGHAATMGYPTEDHSGDFRFLYNYHIKRIMDGIRHLPSTMSLRTMLKKSPANIWQDMQDEHGK